MLLGFLTHKHIGNVDRFYTRYNNRRFHRTRNTQIWGN